MIAARSPLDTWLKQRMGLPALTPEAVAAWQLAELRRTLAWAREHSPFHAARLAGLNLESLGSPADVKTALARLPRMTASDLSAPGLLGVSQDAVARVVSLNTSGTSGAPKRLYFSEADLARTLDFFTVGMGTLCAAGDAVLVLLPGRRQWGVADLLASALPEIKARAVLPQENWVPADFPALLAGASAGCLVAAPGQLSALLEHGEASLAARRRLRTVLSSGEPLAPELRARIEADWGCEVFDHWGMTETGYGGGVECAAHKGYHLREADLLVEVAHPLTGAPLGDGQTGEILVTTLGPRALPLVRYHTGDAASLLPGPCPCGSPLRRLNSVPGRLCACGAGVQQLTKGQGQT